MGETHLRGDEPRHGPTVGVEEVCRVRVGFALTPIFADLSGGHHSGFVLRRSMLGVGVEVERPVGGAGSSPRVGIAHGVQLGTPYLTRGGAGAIGDDAGQIADHASIVEIFDQTTMTRAGDGAAPELIADLRDASGVGVCVGPTLFMGRSFDTCPTAARADYS